MNSFKMNSAKTITFKMNSRSLFLVTSSGVTIDQTITRVGGPSAVTLPQDDGQNLAYQRFAVIQNAVQTARPHVAARRRAVHTATEDVNAKALHTGDNTNDMGARRQPFAADATERA
jgi:hypothetical protein